MVGNEQNIVDRKTVTHTNMQLHLKLQVVYVSVYIALCLTESQRSVSLKVLEANI